MYYTYISCSWSKINVYLLRARTIQKRNVHMQNIQTGSGTRCSRQSKHQCLMHDTGQMVLKSQITSAELK